MKIKVVRIDSTLPLPGYQTEGAAAFDIYAREDCTVAPGEIAYISTNLIVEVPKGYMLALSMRSSTPKKKGLTMLNSPGIVDQDYHGPEDEIKILSYNFTNAPVTIHRGDRFAQGSFVRVDQAEWEEVSEIKKESRGGFGST